MFLLIDSGSAVAGCPRDWCPNIPLREMKQLRFQAAGENQTTEHHGEKDVLIATAGHRITGFNFRMCNVRLPNVSDYRLTQAGGKLAVNDSMARAVGSSTVPSRCKHVDLSWLLRKLFCIAVGNVSRSGTGETGRLRVDPKPLVADEIEAEQVAVQISVRKGPVLPTADQVMKHSATHLPFRD